MNVDNIQQQASVYMDKFLSAINTQLHKIVKPEDADKITKFISDNRQQICIGLGAIALLALTNSILGGGSKKSKKRRRKHKKKHHHHKDKSESVHLTPEQSAKLQITKVLDEFESEYVPKIEKLFDRVEQSENDLKDPKSAEKHRAKIGTVSYKQTYRYQYLFFNESLLKLLMRLDGVQVSGNAKLRAERKEGIQHIQKYCKKLDSFKPRIDALGKHGITA